MHVPTTYCCRSKHQGWTIVEVFALICIIFITATIGNVLAKTFGLWVGIGAGALSAVFCLIIVALFYHVAGRRLKERQMELRKKHQNIYRVTALPADGTKIKKSEGAEIKVGDYGWEAAPPNQDEGLIYLQGLSDTWQVIWYAGFSTGQVEYVAPKPRSQYDWDYSWLSAPPPCPFPVQARSDVGMGLPDTCGWNGPKLLRANKVL
jgi:hypothetical protein